MLAITYSRQSKWEEAEEILKMSLEEISGKERETQSLQLHHALAEVYLNKGDLDRAETRGRQAVNGRIRLLGKEHLSSYQSLYLMVRISYAAEDERKLRSYSASLPNGYWTEDCEEIEELSQMDRNEAAEAVSEGMLKELLMDNKRRGDIERVISTGGLTGTGGYSLIHALTEYGEEAPLRILLERGADPNALDGDGKTALHLAAALDENAENVVRVLLAHHADLDARTTGEGETALVVAVKSSRLAVVQVLLENGADLNAQDRLGYTAIHHAVFQGATTVLRLLVRKGAYIDETGHYGRTALHLAATRGHEAIVTVLKEAGANMKIKDKEKKTALNLAEENHHDGVVRILKGLADSEAQDEEKQEEVQAPTKLQRRTKASKASAAFHHQLEAGL